ncbi:MAG: hypothetical protein JXA89_10345 [Anaerolineae bacterium]|nr:hypothetical protein [Anaerolineae bacterium]
MMTRRRRLMATLRGETVDRPAVSFYEIGGWQPDPDDPDPFNVYNAPDWRPLLQLAEEETDLIRMCQPGIKPAPGNCRDAFFKTETNMVGRSRFTRQTLTVAGRTLTSLTRRDPDVATTWTVEHLLKGVDDIEAYLQLPDQVFASEYDVRPLVEQEAALGDAGIVMVDVGDPICAVASLFSMSDYTIIAFSEPRLFHRLLEQQARALYPMVERVAGAFPGHLWRICGAEYASEPYLPPRLFDEYVVRYTRPMVDTIQKYGGFARIHCHGRLKRILPYIAGMAAAALDPIEPPPQGDVQLLDVRREYGQEMVLFGNIEASEIEMLPPAAFEKRVAQAIREGTAGTGRGFVLLPSACPYGRQIPAQVMANYETMIRLVKGEFG